MGVQKEYATFRDKKIEEWSHKGTEWLCDQLWKARTEATRLRKSEWEHESNVATERIMRDYYDAMLILLNKNGIRPVQLFVTFKEPPCVHEANDCWGDATDDLYEPCCKYDKSEYYEDDCQCGAKWSERTREMRLLSFECSGHVLNGIGTDLKRIMKDYVIKITTANGAVIYEEMQDEEG